MTKYSIWFIPHEPEYSIFKDMIVSLSETYQTPIFIPHVTLLGSIAGSYKDVLGRYRKVIGENPNRIKIDLLNTSRENQWNKALYVTCQKTAQLSDLFMKTLNVFEQELQDYMPHLSLIYGNLPDDTKLIVEQEIHNIYPREIFVESVDLYETEPELKCVKDWKRRESIKLL